MIFGLVEYSPATKCHLTQMSSVLYRKTFFFLRNLYDAVDRGSNMKIVRPPGGGGGLIYAVTMKLQEAQKVKYINCYNKTCE